MSLLSYVQTLRGVIGMLRNPEGTESVFDIEDGLRDIEATKSIVERVAECPDVRASMRERYIAPPADVDELVKLPDGTLGNAFAHHIRDHGFDPDYFRKIDVDSDLDWVLMRMRQTHDIWHVVTGIGTDRFGELGVKAFELAQTLRPLAAVITTGGVLRYLLKEPDHLGEAIAHISHGYQLGRHARPFLSQKWEEGWDVPLAEWRRRVGVPVEAAKLVVPSFEPVCELPADEPDRAAAAEGD